MDQDGPRNEIIIQSGVRDISHEEVGLSTHFEETSENEPEAGRTYLLVMPYETFLLPSFRSMHSALAPVSVSDDPNKKSSSKDLQKCIEEEAARKLAANLDGYTHFTVRDMETFCDRGSVLTDVLEKPLQKDFDKCPT